MSEPMGPQHNTALARLFQSIYLRTPRGIARVCVAGLSGALFLTICVARRNGPIAGEYWPWLGGTGLLIGLLGGLALGVLESRELRGEGPPVWWLVLKRITLTFLLLVFLGLFLILAYCMLLILQMNHLYGF